jgi:hypothetical protein
MMESKEQPASSCLQLRVPALASDGAKDFCILGVLKEIEAMIKCPLP